MILTKLLSWISIVIYTLTFFLSSFAMWVPPVQAADCFFIIFCSYSKKSSFMSKGGVRRGPCAAEELASLIALAPDTKLKSDPISTEKVGETVEGYPTFWFYLPPYDSSIKSAKFVLLDENRHLVQAPIYAEVPQASEKSQVSKNPGIIAGLTLPSKEKALEVGKQYSWYFSILCDFQKPSRNPEVTGQIQRVLPGPLPRVPEPAYIVHNNTYTGTDDIKSVVFYDTVTQLVKKRRTYSSDWNALLSKSEIPNSVNTVELNILDDAPKSCDSLAVS
ncbi:MAG: DUF928 domain-containing protein [Nostoc sp. DedQUE08]|uniref:DUF928 domain-containing protein n=1 Tax=Nostoc sp. DedQUE08 TaxID=3075393 RepID=UPI002AD54AE2|nr:DUF928 domain-containing protein [Nostoc sp. DedQUE08]MDZ8066894.1 DUF928 domain-containing protein [Nostoc sp. DedQUE08]